MGRQHDWLTPLVTLVAVLVGAAASYWGSRELQSVEDRDAARGAARVLQAGYRVKELQLRDAIALLPTRSEDRLVEQVRLLEAATLRDEARLSLADRQLLARNLDAAQWELVARANISLKVVEQETLALELADHVLAGEVTRDELDEAALRVGVAWRRHGVAVALDPDQSEMLRSIEDKRARARMRISFYFQQRSRVLARVAADVKRARLALTDLAAD